MNNNEVWIPIIGMIATCAPVILALIFHYKSKQMRHQQIMTMIEKDMLEGHISDFYHPNQKQRKYSFLPLGIMLLGVGLGLLSGSALSGILRPDDNTAIYFGMILLLGSAGYVFGNMIRYRLLDEASNKDFS